MMPFSDEELINPVKASLEKSLPMLERDGGGLEFLGIKNGIVYVHLIGACKGCASSGTTLNMALKGNLRLIFIQKSL